MKPPDAGNFLCIAHDGRYHSVHTTTIRIREKYIRMVRSRRWTDVRREQVSKREVYSEAGMAISIDVQQEEI